MPRPRRRKNKTRDGQPPIFSWTEDLNVDDHAGCDEAGSLMIYHQKLNYLKSSIKTGMDFNDLQYICESLDKNLCSMKDETLKKYHEDSNNPFSDTNFIIFSCRHNQFILLKYFLMNKRSILFRHYEKIGQKFIAPDSVDKYKHNAFYYGIRSNNVNIIRALTNYWPWYDFSQNEGNLEELLSKSYEELRLKKVDISPEMVVYVEKRLLDLRFFSNAPREDFWQQLSVSRQVSEIVARYDYLIEKIDEIMNSTSFDSSEDMVFLYKLKFVAQNINVLKRLIKSTLDSVPWEEMEFCVIVYVKCRTTVDKLNMMLESVITKRKLLKHLENFAKFLKIQRIKILNQTIDEIKCIPLTKRDNVVKGICDQYPLFQELYNDYESCRDIESLNTIKKYADLAKSANAEEKNGRLVIVRALHVLGEFTKNTLMSPKMSETTGAQLFSNLGSDSRKTVADIRNSLSHSFTLSRRADLEDGDGAFFVKLQNDLQRVNVVISSILFTRAFQITKRQLRKLVESEDFKEMEEILSPFRFVERGCYMEPPNDLGNLNKLINEFAGKFPNPTVTEKYTIDEIKVIADRNKDHIECTREKYKQAVIGLGVLENFRRMTNNCTNTQRFLKFSAGNILKSLSSQTVQLGISQLNTPDASAILGKSVVMLMNSISNRLSNDEFSDMFRLVCEILHLVECGVDSIGTAENLRHELMNHTAKFTYEDFKNQKQSNSTLNDLYGWMTKKTEDLRNVMSHSNGQSLSKLDDEQILAVIEMLSMDILAILANPSVDRLIDNLFSVEMFSPSVVGKCLRNHLAHGNDIVGILVNDTKIAILLNAVMFTQHDITEQTSLIGQMVWSDVNYLQEKDSTHVDLITQQQLLFHSLREGDMEAIKLHIRNGADIAGKTTDCMSALHFAATSQSEKPLNYIIEQWNGPINVRNSEGQNPFHLAAKQGIVENVKLLWTIDKSLLETVDECGNTALHLAASAGRAGVISFLLALHANVDAYNYGGNTPLRLALFNNQVEAFMILVKFHKPNSNSNGGFSPLHIAAEAGSTQLVQYLLAQGESPSALTDTSVTAMHLAALNGHTEVVKALVAKGGNVNATSLEGSTPLLFAAETNREDIVKILVHSGADVNASGTYNFTPIFHAARNGNAEIVKNLLENNARVNSALTSGESPLHCAVECWDNAEVIELLLRHNALINAKDDQGSTPLHYAVHYGRLRSCAVLINNGADTSVVDQSGRSPIFIAAAGGHGDILTMLINANSNINRADLQGLTPLHLACLHRNTGVVKILVNKGAVVNGNLTHELAPLHIAALYGLEEIVDLLLSKGTNVDQRDKFGSTALHHAADMGHTNIIERLIKAGARVNKICSSTGDMPLQTSCRGGHLEASKLLIQMGSSINATDESGCTPLSSALEYKSGSSFSLVKMLIKMGAVVSKEIILEAVISNSLRVVKLLLDKFQNVNENGELLMRACIRNNTGIIKAILTKGADPNVSFMIDRRIWVTPLEYAAENGHENMINLLIEHGADPNLRGFGGETPLHYAAEAGHFQVAVALLAHKAKILTIDDKLRAPIDVAVSNGNVDLVKLFIEHEKNININMTAGVNELSLLHGAIQSGCLDLVKLLIEKGADINLRNSSGSKAIHFAARDGFPDIVDFFLSLNMDLYDRGVGGNTLLHYVAQGPGDDKKGWGGLKVADLLINGKNMDVNRTDDNGVTPLHLAVRLSNDISVIKFFLKNGAYYDLKAKGFEPVDFKVALVFASIRQLFTAAKQGNLAAAQASIESGAIVDAKNKNNETPLLCAAWKGHENIINILLENNANPNIVGKSGSTSLHHAANSGNNKIITSLLGCGANFEISNDAGKVPMDYASETSTVFVFSVIKDSFTKVENRDTTIFKSLQNLKLKTDEVKALLNCTNNEGKTLLSVAISVDFPGVSLLKTTIIGETGRLKRVEQLLSAERYQEALDNISLEVNDGQLIFSKKSLMTTEAMLLMAKALYKLQMYKKLFPLLEDLYDTFREMIGDDNKLTLNTRMFIGLVLHREGRNEEALEIFKFVAEKQKALLHPCDPQALDTKLHMALVLNKLGNIDEALELNYDVLDDYQRIYGALHPITLTAQNNIAMMLNNKGKHDEALELWNYVYGQRKEVLGPEHSDTMRTKGNIATAYVRQGRMNDAINTIDEALGSQNRKLPSYNRDILRNKMNKAMALLRSGECRGAIALFQEVSKNKEHADPDFAGFKATFKFISDIRNIADDELNDESTTENPKPSIFPRILSMTNQQEGCALSEMLSGTTEGNSMNQGRKDGVIQVDNEAPGSQHSSSALNKADVLRRKINEAMTSLRYGDFREAMKLFQEASKNKGHAGPDFASFESLFQCISKVVNDVDAGSFESLFKSISKVSGIEHLNNENSET